MSSLQKLLKKIDSDFDLPMLPTVLSQIKSTTADDRAGANDLAKVILNDQSLTFKLIRIANSSYYKLSAREEISTISQSIVLLGFDTVNDVAIALSAYDKLQENYQNKHLKGFWDHSLACAICSQMLAEATDIDCSEQAFVSGLLHDIGKLILASYFVEEYQIILQMVVEGKDFSTAEKEILGADHGEVGREIAKRWNFPAAIIEVIGDHESEEPSTLHTTNVVKLGNMMANRVFGGDRRISLGHIYKLADSLLDLKPKGMDELLMALGARAREMQGAFSLNLKDITQVTKLVEEENLAIASDPSWNGDTPHETLLRNIDKITEMMVSDTDPGTVYQYINDATLAATATDRVITVLIDEGSMVGSYCSGADTQDLLLKLRLPYSPRQGVLGRTIARSQPFNIMDVRSPLYKSVVSKDDYSLLGLTCFATAPLIVQGRCIGAVVAGRRGNDSPVGDQEMHTLLLFSRLLSVALARDATLFSTESVPGMPPRRTRRSTYTRKP